MTTPLTRPQYTENELGLRAGSTRTGTSSSALP